MDKKIRYGTVRCETDASHELCCRMADGSFCKQAGLLEHEIHNKNISRSRDMHHM